MDVQSDNDDVPTPASVTASQKGKKKKDKPDSDSEEEEEDSDDDSDAGKGSKYGGSVTGSQRGDYRYVICSPCFLYYISQSEGLESIA